MTEAVVPWYRQFWAWFVFAPPLASVVLGVTLVIIAVRHQDAMVVDDYARIGRTFEMQTARDEAARQMGLSARVHWDIAGQTVTAHLPGLTEPPAALRLDLIHPTHADADRSLMLVPGATGIYRATLQVSGPGRRYLQIVPEHGEWRLAGEWDGAAADLVLGPGGS